MIKTAGILLYREKNNDLENGSWSIPKGEFTESEEPLSAAKREFEEETGQKIQGNFELKPIQQKGGKLVYAWAVQENIDADKIVSNTFTLEWPYKSGKWQTYPRLTKQDGFLLMKQKKK